MAITIGPQVEERLRERAGAAGLSIAAYIERLVDAARSAEEELEELALDGLVSGEPIETGSAYWKRSTFA